MKGEDCAEWYECAERFRNDKLMVVIVQKCSKDGFVESDSRLIQVSNAKFWLDVAARRHPPVPHSFPRQDHYHYVPHLAQLVAEFCILPKNQDQLDADTFDKLAATLRWDSYALSETCLKLMQVEKAIGSGSFGEESAPTCLQERCAYYMGCGGLPTRAHRGQRHSRIAQRARSPCPRIGHGRVCETREL